MKSFVSENRSVDQTKLMDCDEGTADAWSYMTPLTPEGHLQLTSKENDLLVTAWFTAFPFSLTVMLSFRNSRIASMEAGDVGCGPSMKLHGLVTGFPLCARRD